MADLLTLHVQAVSKETDDTVTIFFEQATFNPIVYKAGQFITLVLNIGGKEYRRSYSMSSSPKTDKHIAVTVKRVANGVVSNYLNDNIKAGDSLQVQPASGNFFVEPGNTAKHYVLIGAGSGITPLMSIIKTILATEPNSMVSLVLANRNENNIIFKAQLDQMLKGHENQLTVVHVLSQPSKDWAGFSGRIDKTKLLNILNLLPKAQGAETHYFMCGPEGLMSTSLEALNFLKVPDNRIHKEFFTSSTPKPATSSASAEHTMVTLILKGKEYKVNVKNTYSILEAALDEGLDMPYSCQSGVCTSCMSKCKSGKVEMDFTDSLSKDELNKGYVLTCVAHPKTDNVVIEVGS